MCSNWTINGHRCQSGADLIEAIGIDAARKVNSFYASVGETLWTDGKDGRREFICTDETVAKSCLCHVDRDKMAEIFGGEWTYDCHEDAFSNRAPA